MLGVQYSFFASIQYGNAATATILQYLAPVIIMIYITIKNRRIPGIKQIMCLIAAMIGTFLMITKGQLNTLAISNIAIFWGIASAFGAAIYTLLPIKLLKKYGSIPVIGWGMLIGGSIFGILVPPVTGMGEFNASSILAIIFVVLFGTVIAFTCSLESLRYIKPYEASILSCVEPLSASLLSILFLGFVFTPIPWLGTIFIII